MKLRWTMLLLLPALAAAQSTPPPHQLLVVYTSEGGFVASPLFVHLTVYRDGEAILARIDRANPTGRLCEQFVSLTAVNALNSQLSNAGAFYLQDGNPFPDVARATVSFFQPLRGTRARSNSFSYFGTGGGPYVQIGDILQGFINSTFASCP